jgi:Ni/Fe-hydrogenase subunit HybB-like protein
MNHPPEPIGGRILTAPFKALLGLFGLALALSAWRFVVGLGPTTAMTDGYPWGIWIAFDVVTGTALACGGYSVAILVYVMNRGQYHPLIRPAVLTSALGYTIAGLSLAVDVGRPWNFWRVPVYVWRWNFNSALLEVALCIMSYIAVVWIENAPAFLESLRRAKHPILRSIAEQATQILGIVLPFLLALGVLLPAMHQSTLGTLMLLAGHKVHALWQTPVLPLLFLITSLSIGYAAVVFEASLFSMVFKRPPETGPLRGLGRAMIVVLALFLAVRVLDVALRGQLGLAFSAGGKSALFWSELALAAAPLVLLALAGRTAGQATLFRSAVLMMLGGGLYRFDAFLVSFDPGGGWSYFPSVPETLITVGFVAFEIMVYLVAVKRFPILSGRALSRPAG